MSDPSPPDFAMMRAVEILANIYERAQKGLDQPPPPAEKPIVLFSETISFEVNVTTKAEVEKALGIGFSYPALGWCTYCVKGRRGERLFLSAFYSAERLISAELYVPKVDRAPKLAPRTMDVRFVPGDISVGMPVTSLAEYFGRIKGLAPEFGAYADMFEARFPGGSAYAMGNDGVIERLAIYVLDE